MNTTQHCPFPSLFNALAREPQRRRAKASRVPNGGAFGGVTRTQRAERKAIREAKAAAQLRSMNVFPTASISDVS